jgi:hypothetical protein
MYRSDFEKLLSLNVVTPQVESAMREHIDAALASVLSAYDHASTAGHLNSEFQNEHDRRLELIADMKERLKSFLSENRAE